MFNFEKNDVPVQDPVDEIVPEDPEEWAAKEKKEKVEATDGAIAAGEFGTTSCKLNVRETPSMEARVLHVLAKGTAVVIKEITDDGWGELADGGFVRLDFVEF